MQNFAGAGGGAAPRSRDRRGEEGWGFADFSLNTSPPASLYAARSVTRKNKKKIKASAVQW